MYILAKFWFLTLDYKKNSKENAVCVKQGWYMQFARYEEKSYFDLQPVSL